ncbi:MAG: contact-dependent growth inhibition system immunity protein [Pseudomonadota bacterium]
MPTLEILENDYWGEPEFISYLVTTVHRLRKKPLSDFTVEDLRIMLGQDVGTKHILPIALEILEKEPLVEGDFFPGDLLCAVLRLKGLGPAQIARIKAITETLRNRSELFNSIQKDLRSAVEAYG